MINKLNITVLVENTAGGKGLLGEHGLSFLIEADDYRILFDTGQGFVLQHNAQQLNVSLDNLDAIVLSHGHYDHTGGLKDLLNTTDVTKLFVHPQALQPKYSPRGYIGISLDEQFINKRVKQIIWTKTPTEVIPGVYVTGTIPRHHPLEDTGGDFWHDTEHQCSDSLLDDQALYLVSVEGIIVILGCAHAGVINTLDYIAKITGKNHFRAVIGGMHLLNATQARLEATAQVLAQYDVQLIGANHCTGMKAIAFLARELGDRLIDSRVGTRLIFC